MLRSPSMSSGFNLRLLSLKITPGAISNEKEIPPSSSILLVLRRLQRLQNDSFCAFAVSRFSHERDILLTVVTKIEPHIPIQDLELEDHWSLEL